MKKTLTNLLLLIVSFACSVAVSTGQATMPKALIERKEVDLNNETATKKIEKEINTGASQNDVPKPPAKQMPKPSIAPLKPVKTNGEVIFTDRFDTNLNNWETGDTKDAHLKIDKGYYISHKRSERSWVVFIPLHIAWEDDFSIEATLTKLDGTIDYGFGLLWGFNENPREYHSYTLTGSGSYKIGARSGQTFMAFIDWTKSGAINIGNNSTNKISIVHKGDRLNFYINDNLVDTISYSPPKNNGVGFIVENKQTIVVSNILCRRLK